MGPSLLKKERKNYSLANLTGGAQPDCHFFLVVLAESQEMSWPLSEGENRVWLWEHLSKIIQKLRIPTPCPSGETRVSSGQTNISPLGHKQKSRVDWKQLYIWRKIRCMDIGQTRRLWHLCIGSLWIRDISHHGSWACYRSAWSPGGCPNHRPQARGSWP